MNNVQAPLHGTSTPMPIAPPLLTGAASDGDFAKLLRNFDSEPAPQPSQPQAAAPAPAPASAPTPAPQPSSASAKQPETQARQARAELDAQTDASAEAPDATDPSAAATGEPAAAEAPQAARTAQDSRSSKADGDTRAKTDPLSSQRRLRSLRTADGTAATSAPAGSVAPNTPADPGAGGAAQAQVLHARQPAAANDAETDGKSAAGRSARSRVDDAQSRATDRAQGQQVAQRQAQMLDVQAAPLDAPAATASMPASGFAAELQSSLGAAQAGRGNSLSNSGVATVGSSGGGLAAAGSVSIGTAANDDSAVTPTVVDIPQPYDDTGFASALGARLAVLAKDGVQQAELHLNPAEMGPVAVQISVDGSQAQVTFHAAAAETRGVLEQGLPDLAAALAASGLTLAGGGVFQQQSGGREQGDTPNGGNGGGAERGQTFEAGAMSAPGATVIARPQGVVDLYA